MSAMLIVGIVVFFGFTCGELAKRVHLPKVTGFIVAGLVLNPSLTHFIPRDFTEHTDLVTNIALSFITFSVGGTLRFSRIRKLGRSIIAITLCEGEFAFLVSAGGLLLAARLLMPGASWLGMYIPLALLLGCLASPTDPSATLAVVHEYGAKGAVTSTILGVTAFDDVLGIVNFSIATSLSAILLSDQRFTLTSSLWHPAEIIGGAILCGVVFGFAFNGLTRFLRRETEGAWIVAVLAMLSLTFGVAGWLGVDELLATMTAGVVVVNYNPRSEKVFRLLERYTEELIFVLFFTLSGMHLDFSILSHNLLLIFALVFFRSIGKVLGASTGAALSKSPPEVRRYVAGGLIPQGGIVIGLALLMAQRPAFADISKVIISVIIGATVIHELVGPIVSRMAIQAAGEIPSPQDVAAKQP